MKINKIIGAKPLSSDNDQRREQQRFETIREIDHKKTEYERFKRESGVSSEDFKKQNERARKIGFDAMLNDEMNKE